MPMPMSASSKSKPKWKPNTLSKVPTVDAKDISPKLAEPQHRLGSVGVSSGISTRVQPSACVAEVRKICQHYVRKASGKYIDNVTAARYIHQMAEDVLSQLADVSAQIKRHESHPEIYQELLDSWNEVFPPSLGEIGTPKAIANKVKAQAVEIDQLKLRVEELEGSRSEDVNQLKSSMDIQIQHSRDSILNERKQLIFSHKHDIQEMIESFEETRKELQEEKEAIANHYKDMIDKLNVKFNKLEIVKEKEKNDLEMKLQQENIAVMEELDQLTGKHTALKEQSKLKIEQMKQKSLIAREKKMAEMDAQQKGVVIPSNNSIANDSASVVSSIVLELEDAELSVSQTTDGGNDNDETLDDEEWKKYLSESDDDSDLGSDDDEETGADGREVHTSQHTDAVLKGMNMGTDAMSDELFQLKPKKRAKKLAKIEAAKKKAKAAKKQITPVQIKGAVAVKIQKLVDEMKEIEEASTSKDEVVEMMKRDIEKMKIEVMYQKNRADGIDEINKTIRSTNFSPNSGNGSTTITYKRVKKTRTIPVVKHTPHLLMHTRTQGSHLTDK